MNRPNCLLATVDFPPLATGGIARYYYDFCRESSARIAVLAPQGNGCQKFDRAQSFSVTRVNLPLGGSTFSRLLLAVLITVHTVRLLVKGRHSKLIVGHWFLLPPLIWVCRALGVRVAVVLHGGELNRFRSESTVHRLLVAAMNRCDQVIVNSSYTARQFIGHGVDQSRVDVITPGVDSERYTPAHDPGDLPGETAHRGITILTVGTLVERKGHAGIISVMPEVLARYSETRYVIIGDGPYLPQLIGLVERLELQKSVQFLGRLTDDEVISWLRSCDIFVMPSASLQAQFGEEGFGIVYLEANACGKPVIGGDSGGVRDAVVHNVTGLLVEPGNAAALFTALDRLIGDPELRESLGKQGRQRAVSDFSWHSRIEKLVAGI